jgi:hypothetical protein
MCDRILRESGGLGLTDAVVDEKGLGEFPETSSYKEIKLLRDLGTTCFLSLDCLLHAVRTVLSILISTVSVCLA